MGEFWDWAVSAYGRPGVAEACLDMQDTYGQNVPLLLWAIWRGGDIWDAVDAATMWEAEIIGPLRYARRNLKRYGAFEGLRDRIKVSELEAERALMEALEGLAGEIADENALTKVTDRWGGAPPPEALQRLQALITAA